MVSNGGREAATLEVCVKALKEERGLDVERATLNKRRCQVSSHMHNWNCFKAGGGGGGSSEF